MSVSLQSIADEVGVSVSTVSRALAGSSRVSEETRAKIAEAAQELGYTRQKPHTTSDGMRRIGLLMPEQSQTMGFNTRTWLAEIEGITEVGHAKGWSLLIGTYRPDETWLSHQNINGAVLGRTSLEDEGFEIFRKLMIPFVVLNRNIPNTHCVYVDNRRGAEIALDHLLALNHKHFVTIIGPPSFWSISERLKGFRRTLERSGIQLSSRDIVEVSSELSEKDGYRAMASLLEQNREMDAVLAGNDRIAVGAIKAAKEAGLRIPQDLSVVGFDDTISASYVDPPLTTVHIPWRKMARVAAQVLLEVIEDGEFDAVNIRLKSELVVRRSTARRR